MDIGAKLGELKSFFVQCRRVWSILRKPSKEEFRSISKISGLGILALGLLGFVISLVLSIFK